MHSGSVHVAPLSHVQRPSLQQHMCCEIGRPGVTRTYIAAVGTVKSLIILSAIPAFVNNSTAFVVSLV